MTRQAFRNEIIRTAEFVYRRVGPGLMEHNYLCAVCRLEPAVVETWRGTLQPCWDCQKTFMLINLTWIDRLMGRGKR